MGYMTISLVPRDYSIQSPFAKHDEEGEEEEEKESKMKNSKSESTDRYL